MGWFRKKRKVSLVGGEERKTSNFSISRNVLSPLLDPGRLFFLGDIRTTASTRESHRMGSPFQIIPRRIRAGKKGGTPEKVLGSRTGVGLGGLSEIETCLFSLPFSSFAHPFGILLTSLTLQKFCIFLTAASLPCSDQDSLYSSCLDLFRVRVSSSPPSGQPRFFKAARSASVSFHLQDSPKRKKEKGKKKLSLPVLPSSVHPS